MVENNPSPDHAATPADENQLIAERRDKLKTLRERHRAGGAVPFPNDFKPAHHAHDLHDGHGAKTAEVLQAEGQTARVAGRMMLKRVMGKAAFATIRDMSGTIQLYISVNDSGAEALDAFKHWDIGDILGAAGTLFKTRTGELSVKVKSLRLLTKSLRPLPEKFHGLTDPEQVYRQRYLDLIVNQESRARLMLRSRIVASVRATLAARQFIEQRLGANDLMAVVHIGGRVEDSQEFTSNKRLLVATAAFRNEPF